MEQAKQYQPTKGVNITFDLQEYVANINQENKTQLTTVEFLTSRKTFILVLRYKLIIELYTKQYNFSSIARLLKQSHSNILRAIKEDRYNGLTNNSVSIQQYDKNMNPLREFINISMASDVTGIAQSSISNALMGKYQYKSAGGYIWKYA